MSLSHFTQPQFQFFHVMKQSYGTFPESETIRFERLLPGPPERIWNYLTKSELKAKWLAAGNVEPQIGGRVELHFQHKNLSTENDPIPEKYKEYEDGTSTHGTVTQWDPPRLLRYTWAEESGTDSEVTFELIPKKNNKVLLILTHQRLGDDRNMLIGVAAGWHTHLDILADHLNGRIPGGFWKVHTELESEYEKQF